MDLEDHRSLGRQYLFVVVTHRVVGIYPDPAFMSFLEWKF